MQVPAQAAPRSGGLEYKWLVLIVVVFGLFMSILDSTIVNIAIPRLQSAFGADLSSVQWVLTGYTLAQGVGTPLTPYLAGLLGTKRAYLIGLAAFTIGSALCGLSWSLEVLIFFRILQGLGGALLLPLGITLLYTEFPPQERGTATGILGVPILLAPAIGPTLGGYLVTFADWQLIFYINVPIGILAVLLGSLLLREIRVERTPSFDVPGFVFATVGLTSLLYALSDAGTDGWGSGKVLSFLIGGVIALGIFVAVELLVANRGGQPLLDLRLFANRPFAAANLANVFLTFSLFGGLFLLPLYLQVLRGQSAFQAGLILLPQAFASLVGSIVGGRLVDRIGVRPVIIPGLILLAIASWQLTYLTLYTPYTTFQLFIILRGLGLGLCIQPLLVSALSEIPARQLSQGSSINTVTRFVASSLGFAVLATVVQSQTKIHYSHLAQLVTAGSPTGQLMTRLQNVFLARGADLASAKDAAVQVVIRLIQQQGYVLAIQDAFRLALIFGLVALVIAFFMRSHRRPAVTRDVPTTPAAQEQEAPVGALLEV